MKKETATKFRVKAKKTAWKNPYEEISAIGLDSAVFKDYSTFLIVKRGKTLNENYGKTSELVNNPSNDRF